MCFFLAILSIVIYFLVKGYYIHARYVDNLISKMKEDYDGSC